ncbi:MAG: sodium:calcium antiporter [Mariprofundales bacterium]|nr:sodium:calcium antiporter [Mariprofundales bacterium]
MYDTVLLLLGTIGLIYFAAEYFTNALEYLGEKMGVSEGVTGSIFAAIGTAMPETIVPIVAIVAGGDNVALNHDVGMGAILGAPLMLATIAFFLVAITAGIKRGWSTPLHPEPSGLNRDSITFFLAYTVVIGASFIPDDRRAFAIAAAVALFAIYFIYLTMTILASKNLVEAGHGTEANGPLYFAKYFSSSTLTASGQLLFALAILVMSARLFVDGVASTSNALGIAPIVVALLLAPLATELPEKVNSMLWTARGKDTLAFGNLTGAMVFQGSIIPGIAMLLMPWHFDSIYAMLASALAVMGALWVFVLQRWLSLTPKFLLLNGLFYVVFIMFVIL